MKKRLPLILVTLYPYLIILSFLGLFEKSVSFIFPVLVVLYFVVLICSIGTLYTAIVNKRDEQELLRMNMIMKVVQIPSYILIFICALICLSTIFTFALSFFLLFLDCFTIFLTGLVGVAAIIRACEEGKLTRRSAVIHGLLQFVFCIDVISAIIVYVKAKRHK
ncbi:hypothetical protein [Anaerosporobacter sp.]|uniref:hypothetical protein n=1 Tax=Anaerosporobacter sp. TaxID=1872529 RepID=UPI00286FA92C|nr:hypothetical protein [Anaerosporobacter sp.]